MRLKTFFIAAVILASFLSISQKSFPHCEIPCGIYGDSLRIELIAEHIKTIEKSMNEINSIIVSEEINYNQLVRWINNKEHHADLIQEIVSQYFLTQRIHLHEDEVDDDSDYFKQLSLLHKLLIFSMKSKQTTNTEIIEKMRNSLNQFSDIYFDKH